MINYKIKLTFLTPMLGHGATDAPEIRASSIRGQLHNWFRMLGGNIVQERAVFGGIKQKKADFQGHEDTTASRIIIRVRPFVGSIVDAPSLPHKGKDKSAPRKAYAAGTSCEIRVIDRLGGIADHAAEELFDRALRAWLLMGTLGFRSTRAAGSFAWECDEFPMPGNTNDYDSACKVVVEGSECRCALLETVYHDAEKARFVVSDSLGGPHSDDHKAVKDGKLADLAELNEPLGFVKGSKRKTSPLKYRVVKLEDGFHILAFWDGRGCVTGNGVGDFDEVVKLLAERKPKIGLQLKKGFGII